MVAATAKTGSAVTLEDVGRIPTRTTLVGVLRKFGAHVDLRERANATGEAIGTIIVTGDRAGSIHIQPHEAPEPIDDLSVIALLAAHSGVVRAGATELRVKEGGGADTAGDDRPVVTFAIAPRVFETLGRLVA
jgi:5-enolpyruvylshikimate-3-phosphate synthase